MGNIGITEILLILVVLGLPVAGLGLFLLLFFGRSRRTTDLVECRACHKPISPRAQTCPNCGEPRLALRG